MSGVFLPQLAMDATTEISFMRLSATVISFARCVKVRVGIGAMCSTLTSFARKYFAIGSFTAASLLRFACGTPAMAQQQPQQPVVPSPFQGLANVLRNP